MCADGAGEVESVMANRDVGAREVRECRKRERERDRERKSGYTLSWV